MHSIKNPPLGAILCFLISSCFPDPAQAAALPPDFARCEPVPAEVQPGQPVRLEIEAPFDQAAGLELRVPFYVERRNVLPGFAYDAEKRTAALLENGSPRIRDNGPLDRDKRPGRITLEFKTADMDPGLYFLTASLPPKTGKATPAQRHLGFGIASPQDRLEIKVAPSVEMHEGIVHGRFTRLKDGTLLLDKMISTDQGRTWSAPPGGGMTGGCPELSDGRILAMDYSCLPIEGRPGWYSNNQTVSRDGGRTVSRRPVQFHVPQAKAAMGHAPHKGPLFTSSLVESPAGRLVALMIGWFVGDDALCPYGRGRPYSRTYVCESTDGGETWEYLSTVGYDRIGSEGYNEGAIAILPSGELGAVMRTGNMKDPKHQDNPVMFATSGDGGRTWTQPRRVGINGAYPDLKALSDGRLAVSSGRPGAYVIFSHDGGRTWSDRALVDASPYSGYTTLVEAAPGELLVAFSEGSINPKLGRNTVRISRVNYKLAEKK